MNSIEVLFRIFRLKMILKWWGGRGYFLLVAMRVVLWSFLTKVGEDEREVSTLSWFLSQRRTWIIVVVGLLCNLIRRWLCRT
jgi:hypothetical protein